MTRFFVLAGALLCGLAEAAEGDDPCRGAWTEKGTRFTPPLAQDRFFKDGPDCSAGTSPKPSRTSPDGKATAQVSKVAVPEYAYSKGNWDGPSNLHWRLTVARDGHEATSAEVHAGDYLRVFWSPDGRRIAWVIHRYGSVEGPDETPDFDIVVIGPAAGPRVALLGRKSNAPEPLAPMAKTLEEKGWVVANAGANALQADSFPFGKAREGVDWAALKKPAVYAAKGFEEDAKRLAADLGGADVAPLTWEVGAEVVVAVPSKG